MRTARNVAIIAVLAFLVAFLPAGGRIADALMTAITLAFMAAITWSVASLLQARGFSLDDLPVSRRALFYAGTGLVLLMIAGAGNLVQTGPGTLAWLALLGSGVAVMWLVVSENR